MTKTNNPIKQHQPDQATLPRKTLEAKVALQPRFQAANTITRFNRVLGELDLLSVADELAANLELIKNGDMTQVEETLAAQAAVLDTLFNALAVKSLQAPGLENQVVTLKLCFQAQRQCCQTYETLATIKNPPTLTVVRQTNIGRAVQVNNGIPDGNSNSNLENELLENTHGERLDSGTQSPSGHADQDLAALERLDRAEK